MQKKPQKGQSVHTVHITSSDVVFLSLMNCIFISVRGADSHRPQALPRLGFLATRDCHSAKGAQQQETTSWQGNSWDSYRRCSHLVVNLGSISVHCAIQPHYGSCLICRKYKFGKWESWRHDRRWDQCPNVNVWSRKDPCSKIAEIPDKFESNRTWVNKCITGCNYIILHRSWTGWPKNSVLSNKGITSIECCRHTVG